MAAIVASLTTAGVSKPGSPKVKKVKSSIPETCRWKPNNLSRAIEITAWLTGKSGSVIFLVPFVLLVKVAIRMASIAQSSLHENELFWKNLWHFYEIYPH